MFYSIIAPPVAGAQGGSLPREHDGGDRLDHGAAHHRRADGAGDQDRRRDEGHQRPDLTIKATGVPVEVGYDYLRGEGEGISFSTLDPAQRRCPTRQAVGRQLPVEGRQPAGRAGRQEGAHHHHRDRRDPRLDGAGVRVKQDAIPGFVRDTWFRAEQTGDYYGQCAELCGKEHAYMPIHVKVLSAAGLQRPSGSPAREEDGGQGRRSRQGLDDRRAGRPRREGLSCTNCAACHQPNGKGAGPIAARRIGGGARCRCRQQIAVVLNGRQRRDAVVEAAEDTEIAAVITYTKNNSGEQDRQRCSRRPRSRHASRSARGPRAIQQEPES